MKRVALLLIAASMLTLPLFAQTPAGAPIAPPNPPAARVSPHETINAVVAGRGGTASRVIIIYGRPYSKEPRGNNIRTVWGGLVPWGQVWRLGADEATLLVTQRTLVFGTTEVPPGTYSLYMQPEENGTSKLIINKRVGQWGIPYPDDLKAQELARVDLKKDTLTSQLDQLLITVNRTSPQAEGGTIKIAWEKTQFSVDFTIKPQ